MQVHIISQLVIVSYIIKKGHMEGRLAGEIQEDRKPLIECRVFGSHTINFDHSTGFINTTVTGTMKE